MTAAVRQGGRWPGLRLGGAFSALPQRTTPEDRLAWIRCKCRRMPLALAGQLLGMGLLTGVFRGIEPQAPWYGWLLPCFVAWVIRWMLLERLQACHPPAPASALIQWARRDGAIVGFQGAWTGLACGLYQPLASGVNQSTLLIIVFVCVVGAVPALLDRLQLFVLYAAVTAGPLAVAVLWDTTDEDHLHLVGSLMLLLSSAVWMLASHRALAGHLLSQRMRAERLRTQLAEHASQVQAARLQAELHNQAKTSLMAAAGHDIRQPLIALGLYLRQLRAWLCEPRQVTVLDAMNCSLHSVESLTTDLLAYARCEAGVTAPRPQSVCMRDIYARLIPQVGPVAFDKGLSLRWRGADRVVWGDPLMIERVLRNLVLNAVHHTESGGVLVGARRRGQQVVVEVWDSGCGLDASQQARVFEDHYQAAPERGEGCGLGLGIVRRLSHLMDARVTLRSVPGRGTVFALAFRAEAPSARLQLG